MEETDEGALSPLHNAPMMWLRRGTRRSLIRPTFISVGNLGKQLNIFPLHGSIAIVQPRQRIMNYLKNRIRSAGSVLRNRRLNEF